MNRLLRVLLVEDSDDDAQLSLLELARCGYTVHHTRVQDAVSMERELREGSWDLVLCDYSMPGFAAPEAISIARKSGLDLPFIIISGTIGEDTAVDALKQGAHDFLVKGRLARLAPAIERELRDVRVRRERRESEERLRTSEERFRTLVESLDDAVVLLDTNSRVEGVFGRWMERAGITAETMNGLDGAAVLGPRSLAVHVEANARALRGERVEYEWTMALDSGQTRHLQTVISQRLDGAGQVAGTVCVTRDVTEQKQVQEKLLFSDRMASVGMLAAGITHEINNPLAAVLGNLALAVQDVDGVIVHRGSSPELINLRDEIADSVEAAERIQQIVRDVKSFSHADASHIAAVDIHKVLESSVRLGGIELRHRARIVRDYGTVPMVDGNESRLGQVFLNLIVNAAQALRPGSRSDDEIRLTTRVDEDGRVVVEVHDTGVGIPPEQIGRLFTTLFTTKPPGVGTGLGLFICKQIVTALGGDITATSKVGEGTTFRVHLKPAASRAASATERSRSQLPSGRRASVLVVDADESVCDVLRRILSIDCDVVTTTSGRDALRWIGEGKSYDLILLDLTLPDVLGPELHAELARAAPEQARRVIFMTGGVFDAETRKFLEHLATPWLEKPFDASSVRELIARLR